MGNPLSVRCGARRARARPSRRGSTLLETLIAISVVVVGLLGLLGSISTSVSTTAKTREAALGAEAARRVVEELRATPFGDVFATYNDDPLDDPGGPGTAAGSRFEVSGLDPLPTDGDGAAGEVLFPTIAGALREDSQDSLLGMPRDLDADGAVDSEDHSGDYAVLPVLVRVEWSGAKGPGTAEARTILVEY